MFLKFDFFLICHVCNGDVYFCVVFLIDSLYFILR